jgi:hypothetical protein
MDALVCAMNPLSAANAPSAPAQAPLALAQASLALAQASLANRYGQPQFFFSRQVSDYSLSGGTQ